MKFLHLTAPLLLTGLFATANSDDVSVLSAVTSDSLPDHERVSTSDAPVSRWGITPLRPNYVLPVTYSRHPNNQPLRDQGDPNGTYDNVEIKLQLSFGLTLIENMPWRSSDLNVGYTQVSFWNAYNSEQSEPVRDTNYEPEIYVVFDTGFDMLGMTNRAVSVGCVHQSNGEGRDVLSRGWNRAFFSTAMERGNFVLLLKPWVRLGSDSTFDKYLGYGELSGLYTHDEQLFSFMVRNNLRSSENRGAIEAGWSFPLIHELRGYLQLFSGYGESLLDFNHRNQRIGVGILLSDWL